MKNAKTWFALGLAFVATADLLFGDTDKPILPAFISNFLTQQWDLALLAVAAVVYFVV